MNITMSSDFIILFTLVVVTIISMSIILSSKQQINNDLERRLKEVKDRKKHKKKGDEEVFQLMESRKQKQQANLDELLKDSSGYKIDFLEDILKKIALVNKVKKMLKVADIKMPVDLFLMISIGLFLPFLLFSLIKGNIAFIAVGVVLGAIPFFNVKLKIGKITKDFGQFFPDALSLISNSLRAGHSLLSSFQLVVTDAPYPINKLFKSVADDITLGRDIREALEDMITFIPSDDLGFFVTAVLIQKEIGGNLSEILDSLNNTIRERNKLLGMIKTQTAQANLSGIVLGLAPVFISGLVSFLNPEYMGVLYTTPEGNAALSVAIGMSILGFVVIKQITKIRV